MKLGKWIGKGIAFVVLGALLAYLFVLATQLLWNWLVPVLFAGPVINFWQAAGLLLLSKILFGFGGKHHRSRGSWKPYWKERYTRMSPEDRERLKEKMKQKWCSWEDSKHKWNSWEESTEHAAQPKQPEPGA